MKFYHGTTLERWEKIQKEGILFGIIEVLDENGNPSSKYKPQRCTYLATSLGEAKCYGDVVLEVEYNPFLHPKKNNYIDGCWQLRVYEPIPLTDIKQWKDENNQATK